MSRRTVATLAALCVIVTAPVLGTASAARADLVTYCIGTGGAVTVPNDLYVPPGESCSLQGTTITGNVQVAAGANLVVASGRISGDVQVGADGYLDATGTEVRGQVVLAPGGYGVFLRDTTSGPVTLQPKGSATIEGFLFAERTTIDGNVAVSVGEVRLDRTSEVTGNVSSSGAFYTDVSDSFVDGSLSVLNNATGSVVCGSAVRGLATFAGNLGGVQLGPNGTLDGCASGGYWGRDVSITNTTGPVTVDDNIIDGQLQLSSNNPAARVAANNRIRGGVVGEQAAAVAGTTATLRVKGGLRAERRLAAATEAAKAAGPARLLTMRAKPSPA
jgi:cytoskeletal protein CcmA (bactofilin family)